MDYDCDPEKRAANLKKHGVDFDEAASCLFDPMALAMEDGTAESEQRWALVGMSREGRLLTVVYTMRGDLPRLISARKATAKEGQYYAK